MLFDTYSSVNGPRNSSQRRDVILKVDKVSYSYLQQIESTLRSKWWKDMEVWPLG